MKNIENCIQIIKILQLYLKFNIFSLLSTEED